MKAVYLCVLQLLRLIRKDMMLLAACLAPVLAGLAFKFLVPALEAFLCSKLGKAGIIAPYYGLFDLFYSMLAPIMLCFAAAMVVLEERDERTAGYLFISPLGRKGYLISRFVIPAVLAFIFTALLFPLFTLCHLSYLRLLALAASGALIAITIALCIVSFSANKLGGMAVTKAATVLTLGAFVPYFVPGKAQYLSSPLPSFWAAKALIQGDSLYFFLSMALSLVWILGLSRIFIKKRV